MNNIGMWKAKKNSNKKITATQDTQHWKWCHALCKKSCQPEKVPTVLLSGHKNLSLQHDRPQTNCSQFSTAKFHPFQWGKVPCGCHSEWKLCEFEFGQKFCELLCCNFFVKWKYAMDVCQKKKRKLSWILDLIGSVGLN